MSLVLTVFPNPESTVLTAAQATNRRVAAASRAAKRDAAGIRLLDTGRVTNMGRWQPRLNRLGLKDVRRLQCPMRGFIPTCSKADR
jgi:hypothetical protein